MTAQQNKRQQTSGKPRPEAASPPMTDLQGFFGGAPDGKLA